MEWGNFGPWALRLEEMGAAMDTSLDSPSATRGWPPPRWSRRSGWARNQPISQLMAQALQYPELISLAAGFVDNETLPVEKTRQALAELMDDPRLARAALQYGSTAGNPELRNRLRARLAHMDQKPELEQAIELDQVIVTAGSNQLLHLVAEALFDPGDVCLCAAPSYFVFLGTLANLCVHGVPVETDQDGLMPEALEHQLAHFQRSGQLQRVKAVYLVSYFDNPAGITLPLKRREQVLEILRRWNRHQRIYLIEDGAYRLLRYYGEDVPSLRSLDESGQLVVWTDTFSKCFSPGVRVGWGVLPPELAQVVLDLKGNVDFGSPHFAQCVINQVLARGLLEPHVEVLRRAYRTKLEAMLQALEEHLGPLPGCRWIRPQGGLYVWLTLPPEVDTRPEGPLFHAAVERGVLYVPGHYCYPTHGGPVPHNTIRLSFGVQPPERIAQGVRLLAEAIAEVL